MAGKYCFLLHNSYYVPDSISDNGRTESVPLSEGKASSCLQWNQPGLQPFRALEQ